MEPVRLPRGIDDPPQILLWSADELLPFLGMLIVGVLTQRLALCALLSLLVIKLFHRFRDSRPDGYLYHAAYWSGLTPLAGHSLVNPFRRRFLP